MKLRSYLPFLAIVVVIYFISVRFAQDTLLSVEPEITDAYAGMGLAPEPYEAPLYLLGYILIPILALALSQLWKLGFVKMLVVIAGVGAAIFLVIKAAPRIDLPGMANFLNDYLERRSIGHGLWLVFTKRLYIIRIAFAAGLAALGLAYIFRFQFPARWIQRFDQGALVKKLMPLLLLVLLFIIFHPNFPVKENYFNYALLPASEILHGKPLLYETASQYGILNVYLLALALKFILPLSVKSMALFTMILYAIFYILLYYALNSWFGSRFFASFGVGLGLITGFFLLTDPYVTPYTYIGQSVYRHGFFILPFLFIVLFYKTQKRLYEELALIASAFSVLWNIETGVLTVLATMAVFAHVRLADLSQNIRTRALLVLKVAVKQLIYVGMLFGAVSAVNLFVYGSWPNWLLHLRLLTAFENGFGKSPMPAIGLYQILVFVYLAFMVWIAVRFVQRKDVPVPVVFLTIYGSLALLYYVGNSAWSYLNFVSLPMLLLWLYAFVRWQEERLVTATFYGVLAFALVITFAKLPVIFAYRDYRDTSLVSIPKEDRLLHEDAQYIKNNFAEVRIPLLHQDMGKLLVMSDKINALNLQQDGLVLNSLYDSILPYRSFTRGLVNQVEASWPEYVFISNRPEETFSDFENFIKQYYRVETWLNTLNIYRLNLR